MFKKLLVFTFFLFLISSNIYAMDGDRNEGIGIDCIVFFAGRKKCPGCQSKPCKFFLVDFFYFIKLKKHVFSFFCNREDCNGFYLIKGPKNGRRVFNLRCDKCKNKFCGYLANEEEKEQIEKSCLSCRTVTALVCCVCGAALGLYFYLS